MAGDKSTEDWRIELETRIAHQDDALRALGDEVFRQQQQLDQLEATIRHILTRLQDPEGGTPGGDAEDEKPPHY